MSKQSKLYLVKREVYANSMKDALVKSGTIYEVQLAEEKSQPIPDKKPAGFVSKRKTV